MDLRARSHFHSGTSTHRKSLLAHPWAQRSLPDRSLQYKQPMWQHQVPGTLRLRLQRVNPDGRSFWTCLLFAERPEWDAVPKQQHGVPICQDQLTSIPSSRRTPTRSGRSTCVTPTESVLAATREPREPQWLHNGYCRYATS